MDHLVFSTLHLAKELWRFFINDCLPRSFSLFFQIDNDKVSFGSELATIFFVWLVLVCGFIIVYGGFMTIVSYLFLDKQGESMRSQQDMPEEKDRCIMWKASKELTTDEPKDKTE
jgi:hypothetical protein